MNIVAVYSSGRKTGNSTFLVDQAVSKFQEAGAKIKKYYLTDMDIKPCKGCMSCRRKDTCVWEDDMTHLLKDIIKSDFVIFGFPVYMFEASGVFRMMLNRMFPMLEGESKTGQYGKRYPGKKCMLIMTQGSPTIIFGGILRNVKRILKNMMGFEVIGTVRCGLISEIDSVKKNKKALKKIEKICKNVIDIEYKSK